VEKVGGTVNRGSRGTKYQSIEIDFGIKVGGGIPCSVNHGIWLVASVSGGLIFRKQPR